MHLHCAATMQSHCAGSAKRHRAGRAASPGSWSSAMQAHCREIDAVILDEPGYLPFPAAGGALLFHSAKQGLCREISQLYGKTALMITTNLGFTDWVTVFGEPSRTGCPCCREADIRNYNH